ncbi:Phosphoserine aminotransferase (phosphoserine transaminase) [Propionibacterium freudenreichii]|uniref:phosphoserine transaminase n=1 Tax=Propionibacterium freudenreichii TaxID=1744 RepID=UPI000542B2B5|nr:phosphoserine transaminase [Propionibacterium freudenreichii]CEH06970.1 Phosphoserine aminotransferase (phosphoserine transaminase) [Propionibacterium freudenreichii]
MTDLRIPTDLLPRDGRFGSGPGKVRPEAMAALAQSPLMGTSHRKPPVKSLVAHIQEQLAALYSLPDDYRVVLGDGGASLFWDLACVSLVRRHSSHGVYGEFSRKCAAAVSRTPWLDKPTIVEANYGSGAFPATDEHADLYAWAQNETSTGVAMPVQRPAGIADDALVMIDATSAAGGLAADVRQADALYFAPQKNFSSDGGLWLALCSPAALERAAELTAAPDGRWVPDVLNLTLAADNSAKHQTLNTPAIATLVLLGNQLDWMMDNGGMDFVAGRTTDSARRLYDWVEAHEVARPFVADPALRSNVVGTVVFDERVDAPQLCKVLRANGIVDIEPYRKLGTDQIRVGMFASVDPDDVSALLACIDWVLERII